MWVGLAIKGCVYWRHMSKPSSRKSLEGSGYKMSIEKFGGGTHMTLCLYINNSTTKFQGEGGGEEG